jgi:Domain of unknown function (DUF222)
MAKLVDFDEHGNRTKLSRTTEGLIANVTQHHRAITAHQRQLLAAVAQLDRRKAWRVDGATSMVAWLVQRCGVTAATAREWVNAAPRLEELPKIGDAMAQGKLSFDQVKPLVEVAKPETDAQLAEAATHWSAKQVRELAADARRESDESATAWYNRRFLRFDDKRRAFNGVLPSDQYSRVKMILVDRASRKLKSRTPFDQRMADALVEVCAGGAAGAGGDGSGDRAGGPGRDRPTVVVHTDLEYLAGGEGTAELDVLGPLSPEVARRLACDAKVIMSVDDAEGRSIDQGRARRAPSDGQRLEIRRRDRGCRFPGCTHTEFTDVHHVTHWANGGPTDLFNLVELCDMHHRSIHEMGWVVRGDANVELEFVSPTGRVTTSTPSPVFVPRRSRRGAESGAGAAGGAGAARDGPPG